ncbi:MAG TPA: aminoglycoside phosphotransferase family protein [Thermomicrobiales bacterium]|nr:aminoglycoside phosphotransferase family protein [Thermomicrobiales bacterium]
MQRDDVIRQSTDHADVRPGDLTQDDVRRFLADRLGDGIRRVEPIGHGEWSKAFAFDHGEREYVVRFGRYREDFEKDRVASRYATVDLPIPQMIEIGEAFGGYFAISTRAYGTYIDEVDGAAMHALLPALFAMLDAARDVDLSGTTGYGGWDGDGNAAHATWREALLAIGGDHARIPGWRQRLAASPTGTGPFEECYARLAELLPFSPAERHLIHSDLLHFNVLTRGDRLTAVLDWGSALYGDFLYDVAWFVYWSPWFPAWNGIDFAAEARRHYEAIGLDVPYFEERLRCCQLHIGLDNMAYSAFTGRPSQIDEVARLTLAIARGN